MDLSDRELLRAYATRRSEADFQTLVKRHVNLVYGTALRRLNDTAIAEEVSQTVFLALARKAPFLLHLNSIAGWLYRTASLEACHRLRSEIRRREREETAAELATIMNSDDTLWQTLIPDLDDGLDQLPEKDRHALVLRFFEQKSLREVGAAIGISEDAARKRVDAALEKLARALRRSGVVAPTVALTTAALRGATLAAPAGIAAAITQAVMTTGGAVSISSLALFFAKFMGLTKTQTAAVCLLLAAGPVMFEMNRYNQAQAANVKLLEEVRAARRELDTREEESRQWPGRLALQDASLAARKESLAKIRDSAAAGTPNERWYLWQKDSDYVRLPKTLTKDLVLSRATSIASPEGGHQRLQNPVAARNGMISEVLAKALDISADEQAKVAEAVGDFAGKYRALEKANTYETNRPLKEVNVGDRPSKTVVTAAFPEAGGLLENELRTRLDAALGAERTDVLWQQGADLARRYFGDFGKLSIYETVAVGPDNNVSYWRLSRKTGESSFSEWTNTGGPRSPESVPEPFRSFVADWLAKLPAKKTTP